MRVVKQFRGRPTRENCLYLAEWMMRPSASLMKMNSNGREGLRRFP